MKWNPVIAVVAVCFGTSGFEQPSDAGLKVANVRMSKSVKADGVSNTARFGYYWNDDCAPYDQECRFEYDLSVFPQGIFSTDTPHDFAYLTAENKHIFYGGIPYGLEVVGQYGYGKTNEKSVKKIWLAGLQSEKVVDWWIDKDATGGGKFPDGWDIDVLQLRGFVQDELVAGLNQKCVRVRIDTRFIAEDVAADTSDWRTEMSLYNIKDKHWVIKAWHRFHVPASREIVRSTTYHHGSGIWAGILETYSDNKTTLDSNGPPVRAITYTNRHLWTVDRGREQEIQLNETTNHWIAPSGNYQVFDRTMPTYSAFTCGTTRH